MRSLTFTQYGEPGTMELADMQTPVPGPGEVLIQVAAAGLNPVDALQREGMFKAIDPYRFPKIAGNELSGTVAAVGPGVQWPTAGQEVVARVGTSELGALSELAVTRAEYVAAAPTTIPLADAAGLPLAGLTAQQALGPEHLNVRSGDKVLITGAAGGVGQLAVQLAALVGAEVIATASPEGEEIVRRAGASRVINYREHKISEIGERFTKVLDLVGGDTVADVVGAVPPGARVTSIAGPPTPGSLTAIAKPTRRPIAAIAERLGGRAISKQARSRKVAYEFFLMHPDGAGLAELVRLVDEGKLTVPIDSRFALNDYADAFERLESRRSKGKVIVKI